LTRTALLEMRDYPPDVIAGHGNGNGTAMVVTSGPDETTPSPARCSQCSEPAKPGRPTCGSAACVTAHRLARKRASYRDRGRPSRRRRNEQTVSAVPVGPGVTAVAAVAPSPSSVTLLELLQAAALGMGDSSGWTATIAPGNVVLAWTA
jgi:hypothetical protein